jgi:hypothetical protein
MDFSKKAAPAKPAPQPQQYQKKSCPKPAAKSNNGHHYGQKKHAHKHHRGCKHGR